MHEDGTSSIPESKNLSPRTGVKCEVKVAQSCLTLCNPMDYTVHGILQARIATPWTRQSMEFSRPEYWSE